MKSIQQLVQNVIGQLEGVKKMIDEGEDCLKVLIQLKASRSALASLSAKFISSNLEKCASLNSSKKKQDFQKIISELSKI